MLCYPYEKQGFTGEGEGSTTYREWDNAPAPRGQRRPAPARVPDRRGGRPADEGRGEGQGVRPPRQHDGPRGLPPRLARRRAGRGALGSARLQAGHLPRAPAQGRPRQRALHPRHRAACAPPLAARAGGPELRPRRGLQRERVPSSPYLFTTKRKTPITAAAFRKQLARIAAEAEFPFPVHPHMLRHACGFKLANDGKDTRALQEWLGHQNIQHTVRYTELTPTRFKSFFEEED